MSGKPGNFQILLRLPHDLPWEGLKNRIVIRQGKSQLEIRGTFHQSVLMGKHPDTGRYHWAIALWEIEEIPCAPTWIGEFLQGVRQPEQDSNIQLPPRKSTTISPGGVRFPARLPGHYGTPLIKIWLLARSLDPTNCGRVTFTLATAGQLLQRSVTTVRRLLGKAAIAGLIRKFTTHDGVATVYYAALDKAAAAAGLEQQGRDCRNWLERYPQRGNQSN